jgi:tungstate transport system permease protein
VTGKIVTGIIQAFQLLFSLDSEIYTIVFRSLYVSGLAIAMAVIWSVPVAAVLGLRNFRGKRFIRGSFNAFIGFPTVVLGLILFLMFSR